MAKLEIRDLAVAYGKVQALKGVTLEVGEREIVAIVGSNGAGKSTLLKAVMGLLPISQGEIRLGDLRLDRSDPTVIIRAGVAISPEGRRLFPEMEVVENLMLGAYQCDRGQAARTLAAVYEWFPLLAERSRQIAGSLSGGEQQMVAIGRALMSSPRLLLLDEPSLGLSPLMMREIVRIIRRIHSEGISVVLVEQNARVALKLADRAYVMQTGLITLTGSGRELLDNPEVQRSYLGVERGAT